MLVIRLFTVSIIDKDDQLILECFTTWEIVLTDF